MRRWTTRVGGAAALAALLMLGACSGGGSGGESSADSSGDPLASKGQVAAAPAYKVSYYAAARFAEQASFGPTQTLVDEIRKKGFEAWIDEQFALPPSQVDLTPFSGFVNPTPDREWKAYQRSIPDIAVGGPDQLRLRVTWALSQVIVTSDRKGDLVGALNWFNMLQQQSLGRYPELLYEVSVHPMMGQYLDNNQNRPKSEECPSCAPNENFARELMQLFTIGVYKLNADGTPERDARGRVIESYTQRDVEELARVLTGWEMNNDPPNRPNRNWANWAKPMVPSTWPPTRDSGAKTVLGTKFAAGQSHQEDLRQALAMLVAHPNSAPFLATRLIQHLVKSNPTPAYVARVGAVFRNNGKGVVGDLKAVVKAVLLDTEARAGDVPTLALTGDGKFREPFLHSVAAWRALGCSKIPSTNWGDVSISGTQRPLNAESVFSFYAPTDRAPGSNLLAPEQRLFTSQEIRNRTGFAEWPSTWNSTTNRRDMANFVTAGCQTETLRQAFVESPRAFNDFLAARYFRGAMPPTLRSTIEQLMREPYPPWNRDDPNEGALRVLNFALTTSYYGVIR